MPDYLDLDTRKRIYGCIKGSPGLHFREIQRRTGMATGSLDYHLHFLHKNGLVRMEKSGRFTRYYTADVAYDEKDRALLGVLRQGQSRKIIIYLMQKNKAAASDIAKAAGLSPSNLSWHLRLLEEKGIVRYYKKGRFRFYSVVDKESIAKCLTTHKTSFLDTLVDGFIDAWEAE